MSVIIVVLFAIVLLLYLILKPTPSYSLRWVREYHVGVDSPNSDLRPEVLLTHGNNEAYAVGVNKNGYVVFKDPMRAFEQFQKDYEIEIKEIMQEYYLRKFSFRTCRSYMAYGWQMPYTNESTNHHDVTLFIDIFMHSFSRRYHYLY